MNIVIRKLRSGDGKEFQKLMTQLFLLHTATFEKEKPNLAVIKADVAKTFKNLLSSKKDACFVAISGEAIVGFVSVLTGDAKYKGYLDDLFIAPRYRQKGIGKQLMDQAFVWFRNRGMTNIELDVHRDNRVALETYKKLGFKKKPQQYDTYETQLC